LYCSASERARQLTLLLLLLLLLLLSPQLLLLLLLLLQDTRLAFEDIEMQFGATVRKIVEGETKVHATLTSQLLHCNRMLLGVHKQKLCTAVALQ
jgi:(p)ppGpp synthase/HD superfamily hydrolase